MLDKVFCEKCNNEMVFVSGNRKSDGKPYKGWKCQVCNNYKSIPVTVNSSVPSVKPKSSSSYWEKIMKEKEEAIKRNVLLKAEGQAKGLAFSRTVDIVLAMYEKGDIVADVIVEKIRELLPVLKELNKNGEEYMSNM